QRFAGSTAWAFLHLALLVPAMMVAVWVLIDHLRRATTVAESARTRLLLAALAILVVLASSEMVADLGFDVPRLGSVGSLAAAAILAVIALRLELFERRLSAVLIVYALAVGSIAVVAYLALFYFLRASTNAAVLVIGVVTVTIALLAVMQRLVIIVAGRRDRLDRLVPI